MFSKNKVKIAKDKAKAARKAEENKKEPAIPSILSKNLRIIGNLETEGDIQVEGVVDGDVKTHLLTIGVGAVVNGSIIGDTIRVDGTVKGQITGRIVELGKSAKVTGDMLHSRATSAKRAVARRVVSLIKRWVMAPVRAPSSL